MCDHITAAALNAVIAVFVRPVLLVEAGVEVSKATVKAGRHIRLGIKNERFDEGGCMIAALLQDLRERGKKAGQRVAEIGHRMKLGIGARKNRRVRNRRERRLRIGAFKNDSLASKNIEIGRDPALRTEKAHAVGAGSIDGHQDDVRGLRPGKAGDEKDEKEEGTPHKNKKGVYQR